jgi:signal transduction histidine kinase
LAQEHSWPTRRLRSIAARLFLAVALPAATVVVALGVLAWRTTREAVETSLRRELSAAVAAAATSVSVRSAGQIVEGGEGESSYRRTVTRLKQIASFTGSSRVMIIDDKETVRADHTGSIAVGTPAPRVALDRVELARALAGHAAVSEPFRADDGRRFLAAYARVTPASDDAHEVTRSPRLVLVIEAPAKALDATDATARQLAILVGLAVLLVLSLALVVARTITGPLLRLADETERLGRGELLTKLALPGGDDEVGRLGRTLESMRKALVDRDTERQMMLAGIAHEIRNPLGGMELFSGLLEEGIAELPPSVAAAPRRQELLEQAGRLRKELRYLTEVVNSFLAFARDAPLTKEPVDVKALLDDVSSLCRRDDRARIEVRTPPDGGTVEMDRARIKQALLNLVDNALAATPADGCVTLRATRDERGLMLVVEDTGKGMDPDTLARAWTPFFTTKEKGSGLGLALVRKLAREHGGDAEVTSMPGQGTTASLLIPWGGAAVTSMATRVSG